MSTTDLRVFDLRSRIMLAASGMLRMPPHMMYELAGRAIAIADQQVKMPELTVVQVELEHYIYNQQVVAGACISASYGEAKQMWLLQATYGYVGMDEITTSTHVKTKFSRALDDQKWELVDTWYDPCDNNSVG